MSILNTTVFSDGFLIELIGMIACLFTTISTLPQLTQMYRSRLVRDVSTIMYVALCLGLLLWVVYGILCESVSLVITNIASLLTAFPILVLKYKWKYRGN